MSVATLFNLFLLAALVAYDDNIKTINFVADHAVLAWAAYEDKDALELAKQRGWNPMRSIVNENLLTGYTAASLFTNDDGRSVLAFRGTTKSFGDWLTNILGTVLDTPLLNSQVEGAEQIAREIVK